MTSVSFTLGRCENDGSSLVDRAVLELLYPKP